MFQTVEDLYTQSYVMPFLMPMLENAGAYVMSPRERDVNTTEIIIDNDNSDFTGGTFHLDGKKTGSVKGFGYKNATLKTESTPSKQAQPLALPPRGTQNRMARQAGARRYRLTATTPYISATRAPQRAQKQPITASMQPTAAMISR